MALETRAHSHVADVASLAAIAAAHGVNDGFATLIFPILPLVVKEFSLHPVEAGMLVSAYNLTSSACQLPLSFVSDYTGRRRLILLLGLTVASLTFLSLGTIDSFPVFLVAMALAGVGNAGYHPQATVLVAERFGRAKATALGVHGVGGNVGNSIFPGVMGFLATYLGWRGGMPVFTVVGLVVAAAVYLTYNDPKIHVRSLARSAAGIRTEILSNRSLFLVAATGACRAAAERGMVTFLPLYAAQILGMDAAAIGAMLSVFYLVGISFQPFGGVLSDRFGHHRLIAFYLLAGTVPLALIAFAPSVQILFVVVALNGAFAFAIRPIMMALCTELVDERVRASAVGLLFTSNQLSGGLSPVIGGFAVQMLGYQHSFLFFAGFLVLGAMCALGIRSRTPVSEVSVG